VEAPPYWVGYRLIPFEVELWEQAPDRLHDRFRYTHTDTGAWRLERLTP
jgi:pyridoxamine 5'-phosphate oxidase